MRHEPKSVATHYVADLRVNVIDWEDGTVGVEVARVVTESARMSAVRFIHADTCPLLDDGPCTCTGGPNASPTAAYTATTCPCGHDRTSHTPLDFGTCSECPNGTCGKHPGLLWDPWHRDTLRERDALAAEIAQLRHRMETQ